MPPSPGKLQIVMDRGDPGTGTGKPKGGWSGDPERVDPDDYPSSQPFVRLMTWAPCSDCDLQVHTLLVRFLLQGIDCAVCGASLLPPPHDATARLARVMHSEDALSFQLDAH